MMKICEIAINTDNELHIYTIILVKKNTSIAAVATVVIITILF